MQSILKTFNVLAVLFFFTNAFSQFEDTLDLSIPSPATGGPDYTNSAQEGSYERDFYVGEVPEWHYYDLFGNKLLDGFYLYSMKTNRNSEGTGESSIALHPFMNKWYGGLLQVGDITDKAGIMALIGEGINTRFTPFSLNQTYYTGSRFDMFFDGLGGLNSASLIASRISNTARFSAVKEYPIVTNEGDWLLGFHLSKKYKDLFEFGGTCLNIHHEDGEMWKGNKFNGWDGDTLATHTPTALSVYGFDGRCNLPGPKLTLYSEYKRSQEVLDGNFKPSAGNVGILNGHWDFLDKGRFGGEGYVVESRFKTTFSCAVDTNPDEFGCRKYLYSLVEDNDDGDRFPENAANKLLAIPTGDPDGVIPVKYDKDKNGMNDWEQDFLNYDCDPPKSKLYFDRNNNGTPDDIEEDAYPDYTYVPSYYLPGEQYWRYDDLDRQKKEYTSDGTTHKGLLGIHLYGRYEILPKLNVTLGMIAEKSQEKSYQNIYKNSSVVGLTYASEIATTPYLLIQYEKYFADDKNLTIQNYFRLVKDNIPNHTQTFSFAAGSDIEHQDSYIEYQTVVDELDYRDAVVNMLIAQYSIFRNRGFNVTTRGKYEFTKQFAYLEYNYPDENISSLILINKCHYIWLLPVLKDMFLIPRYKNIYQFDNYGPRLDRLDLIYRNHSMINIGQLVYDWQISQKTAVTLGLQAKTFNDFFNAKENYYMRNFSTQLLIRDRYGSLNLILTTGFSLYKYVFHNTSGIMHNPFNNPHRIGDNISSYDLFIKIHGGF